MNKKLGKNSVDLQSMNRTLILNIIRKFENITRVEISRKSGLNRSTITNIVNDLINSKLVIENGSVRGGVGRNSIKLSLNHKKYRLLSIRFARKHILYGVFDIKLNNYEIIKENIDLSNSPESILNNVKLKIKELLDKYPDNEFLGIGIAVPGPFAEREGHIIYSTEFTGWEKIDIATYLSNNFNMPITIEHDAKAGALCEWWLSSDFMDKGTLVYLAAGQGIGAGVIVDGEILTGSIGTFGEIGHTSIKYDGELCKCGNRGCLELYSSSIILMKKMRQYIDEKKFPTTSLNKNSNLDEFCKALWSGDPLAKYVFEEIAQFLSLGVVNIINTFNPDIVVIGDDLSKAGDLLLNTMKSYVKSHILHDIYDNLIIKVSESEIDSALIGAASYLFEHLF